MSRNFVKIFSSEMVLITLSFQILFGAMPYVSAANPTLHETIQTASAVSSYAFDMGGTTYLAIWNALSGSAAMIVQPQSSGVSTVIQTLPESASDFEYFTISGESYLAVAQNYTDDVIYKYDGSSFTGFQILPSNIQATAFKSMTLSGWQYLAVANAYSDYSKILEWTGTGFASLYDIWTSAGWTSDVEGFEIKNRAIQEYPSNVYLPYAQLMADNAIIASGSEASYALTGKMTRAEFAQMVARIGGYSPVACQGTLYNDVNNTIPECGYIESLYAGGVIDATSSYNPGAYITKIDAVQMLLRAMGEHSSAAETPYGDMADFDANTVGYATRVSELNCMATDTEFVPYYMMNRGQIYMLATCLMGWTGTPEPMGTVTSSGSYVALSDGKIYALSSTSIAMTQDLHIVAPADVQFVKDGYNQYLIFLSHGSSDLSVYRWNWTQFDLVDNSIRTNTSWGNTLGFDSFTAKWKTYIVMSRWNDASSIYVFNNNKLEEYQSIGLIQPGNTELHADWTQFKLAGKQMLFLANSLNVNSSYMLEWNEVPYVVVDWPVSGESYQSNVWDSAVTPIDWHGNPNMEIAIYDANGINIAWGMTDANGFFSLFTTANSGTVLPIRVVPYSGALIGDEKTIDYLDIRPAPIPTTSRPSWAFNTGFTLIISGEAPYYSTGHSIQYSVYEDWFFTVSGEFFWSRDIVISPKNTYIEFNGYDMITWKYIGFDAREFYYDTTAPTLAHDVVNALAPVQSTNRIITGVWPEITQTILDEHITHISIDNPSQTTSIYPNQISLFIKTQSGMSYSGTICLRMVGSMSSCGSYDSTSWVNLVPGINTLNFTIPSDTNGISPGWYKEYEIYSDLTSILAPGSIVQTSIIGLDYATNYAPSVTSLYPWVVGSDFLYTVWWSSISGTVQPTSTTASLDTYFVTGSLTQVMLQTYDDGLYFGGAEADILPQFGDVLSWVTNSYAYIGNHGVIKTVSWTKGANLWDNIVRYTSTDNVGNHTEKAFDIYRVPSLEPVIFTHSWSDVYAVFESESVVSWEYQYTTTAWQSHTGIVLTHSGVNSMILTGVIMSGTVTFTIGVQKDQWWIILPDTVYNTLKQTMSYTFDPTPTVFTITPRTSVALWQTIEYGPYTLTGFNMPLAASVSTGAISINSWTYTTGSVTVSPWDTITIQLIAPTTYTTTKTWVLIIGSTAMTYSLETLMAPPVIVVPTTPVVVPPAAGPGGGGGSAAGTAGIIITSSSLWSTSTTIQGLLLNSIGKGVSTSSSSVTENDILTSIKVVAEIYSTNIQKNIENLATLSEKVTTIDTSIDSYNKKMKETKVLSSEYLVYRKIKKNLIELKRSLF